MIDIVFLRRTLKPRLTNMQLNPNNKYTTISFQNLFRKTAIFEVVVLNYFFRARLLHFEDAPVLLSTPGGWLL